MWQIFDEQSGNICLKLRFYGTQHGQDGNSQQNARNGTFKRRSEAQTRRDRDRAGRHQMRTRSQRQAAHDDGDKAQDVSSTSIEDARCGDFTMDSPVVVLNPLATPFINPQPLEDPELVTPSPLTPDFDHNEENQCEIPHEEEISLDIDLPDLTEDPAVPEYPDVCPEDDDDQNMTGCNYAACSYGLLFEAGLDTVFACRICRDMLKVNTYVCDSCLKEGAHRGHRQWLTRTRVK